MKVILDECCHGRIKKALQGFDDSTVQSEGWSGIKNGDLLQRISGKFDVFVTQDQNISQQNAIKGRPFCLLVVVTPSGLWSELEPLMATLREEIQRAKNGMLLIIRA